MKRSRIINIFFIFSLCVFFSSCQPVHTPVPAPNPTQPTSTQARLKTMIRSSAQFYNEYNYVYNTSGQLTSYILRVGESANSPSQTTRFTYDSQGKLTSAERLPAVSFTSSRLLYTYDAAGRLIQMHVYEEINKDGQFPLTQTIEFAYNSTNEVSQTTITSGSRVEQTKYTYATGNVIKTERTLLPGGDTETINYQHDDKPNPLYGLLMTTPSAELFNKNNIKYDGSQLTYSDGLLTSLQLQVNQSPNVQSLIRYIYETSPR